MCLRYRRENRQDGVEIVERRIPQFRADRQVGISTFFQNFRILKK
jgi:hypothetical protein